MATLCIGRRQRHEAKRFEGMDELDAVNGMGTIEGDGDSMIFVLSCHQGDDWTYHAKRAG